MPHKTGHEDKWGSISAARKRAIRAEMLRRWKQKLRKKGASKAAGGDPTKTSGVYKTGAKKGQKYGTGSLKGWVTDTGQKLTKDEIKYAQTVRKTQRKKAKADPEYKLPGMKKTRKAVAKTARKTGAGSAKLVAAQEMKSKKKGGTVSRGSHKAVAGQKGGGAKRIAAKAWRKKHVDAAKKKYKIGAGSTAAQRKSYKAQRAKIIKRHKHMIGK
jgi:hypothetical protein